MLPQPCPSASRQHIRVLPRLLILLTVLGYLSGTNQAVILCVMYSALKRIILASGVDLAGVPGLGRPLVLFGLLGPLAIVTMLIWHFVYHAPLGYHHHISGCLLMAVILTLIPPYPGTLTETDSILVWQVLLFMKALIIEVNDPHTRVFTYLVEGPYQPLDFELLPAAAGSCFLRTAYFSLSYLYIQKTLTRRVQGYNRHLALIYTLVGVCAGSWYWYHTIWYPRPGSYPTAYREVSMGFVARRYLEWVRSLGDEKIQALFRRYLFSVVFISLKIYTLYRLCFRFVRPRLPTRLSDALFRKLYHILIYDATSVLLIDLALLLILSTFLLLLLVFLEAVRGHVPSLYHRLTDRYVRDRYYMVELSHIFLLLCVSLYFSIYALLTSEARGRAWFDGTYRAIGPDLHSRRVLFWESSPRRFQVSNFIPFAGIITVVSADSWAVYGPALYALYLKRPPPTVENTFSIRFWRSTKQSGAAETAEPTETACQSTYMYSRPMLCQGRTVIGSLTILAITTVSMWNFGFDLVCTLVVATCVMLYELTATMDNLVLPLVFIFYGILVHVMETLLREWVRPSRS
ncbi:hypothetical protein GMRT_11706 [Giardia muris]|uniref:dolichol kinase n=1 Tax=Giardia muris TaxID=5742 RepID=A0A4Z1SPC3_GIAMU|nr:hypothetical protein GMRT_11706 [Giardia muris]|eukprot:TNJ26715.1 hypothetical protein GMRT_11706 [Giardia muris]